MKMMDVAKLKNIVDNGGGDEHVKMFMIMNGNNVAYGDTPFDFSEDIDEGNELLIVRGRKDVFGSTYTVYYDLEQIIGVIMSDDVPASELETMSVRG